MMTRRIQTSISTILALQPLTRHHITMPATDTPIHELFGVPTNTPQYVFQGEEHCCQVLSHETNLLDSDQSDQHGQYVIFSNVDKNIYDQYFIYSHDHARGYEHIPDKKLALVELTTRATEVATAQLQNVLFEKLVDMGHANRKLACLGTWDFESKDGGKFRRSPDMSYMPKHFSPKKTRWPTIVMETGYATSKRKLDWNARWWLNDTGGQTKMVLVLFSVGDGSGCFRDGNVLIRCRLLRMRLCCRVRG